MLYPQVDLQEWLEKYDLKTKEGICHKCGYFIIAEVPFAEAKMRGLVSRDHGCGEEALLYVFVNMEKK